MAVKSVLITGANSGIGKATALALATEGWQVIMLCRNEQRGQAALEEVRELSGNDNVTLALCDLGDLSSIRKFAAEFLAKHSDLDVLVNNAGVMLSERRETVDGYEAHFGINHLGHFLLTNLLLDIIRGRIVTVTSGIQMIGKINFDDINLVKKFSASGAYAQSKLANVLFTYELARRLEGTGVTATCVQPGFVATDLTLDRQSGKGGFMAWLFKHFGIPPAKGADTIIYLASSPEVEGVTGKYYYKRKPRRSASLSYDREVAERLWQLSEEMTGLAP